jgi:hypothetical protein
LDSKYVTTDSEYRPVDFGQKAQFFTLDVVSEVAHGVPFGFLATETDVRQYIKNSEKVLPAAMMITVLPWLNTLLQSGLLKSVLPSEKDSLGFGKVKGSVVSSPL